MEPIEATTPGLIYVEEEDDDIPVGRVLSRKEALLFLSGAGMVFLAGCGGGGSAVSSPVLSSSSPSTTGASSSLSSSSSVVANCVAFPEETQGPYWVDEMLDRSDIRLDPTTGAVKAGVPLTLNLVLANVTQGCGLISGAQIDIWQCDATGVYSDVTANNTVGQKWLRGYQTTDSAGKAQFVTIYPGWYSGRTTHIHFRVRFAANGTSYNLASQLFFDDAVTSTVYAAQPAYVARGQKNVANSRDGLYHSELQLVLSGTAASGYTATFVMGVAVR